MQQKPKNRLQKLLNKKRKIDSGKYHMTAMDYDKLCSQIRAERIKLYAKGGIIA